MYPTRITQHEVSACAGGNRIACATTDNRIRTCARRNQVSTAKIIGCGFRNVEQQDTTSIAQDHIVTIASRNRIRARAADDGIRTYAGFNQVVATDTVIQRGNLILAQDGGDSTLITQNTIVAVARANCIRTNAADDAVDAHTCGDQIVAANPARRAEPDTRGCVNFKIPAIAQNEVVAGIRANRICTCAAQGHVIARTQGDDIVTAKSLVQRCDHQHIVGQHCCVVTRDDIVASTRINRIRIRAGKDCVCARACRNEVSAADHRLQRLRSDVRERDDNLAAVTDDHVLAAGRGNRIRTRACNNHIKSVARHDDVSRTVQGVGTG